MFIFDLVNDKDPLNEGSQIERKIARTQALIQDYYDRARQTRNDIKKNHYIDMARQLEYELDGMINDANQAEQDSYDVAQHDAEPSATWNRGGLAEAQSMGGALANALSRAEPGSKLDKKIKHHNDMVRRFGKGTMTSAPDGYHIDKKGLIRLGQGLTETKVSKYKDLGATKDTTHFIKNVTTGEIVSPHRGKQDAEDALVAHYRGPRDGNEYKIVRARKEGVAEGSLNEFAPTFGGDDDENIVDTLMSYMQQNYPKAVKQFGDMTVYEVINDRASMGYYRPEEMKNKDLDDLATDVIAVLKDEYDDEELNEFAPGNGDGDGRSKLIGSIAQLLKSGKKVDFFVPGIRGHVSGIGGGGEWVTLKRWNKPYSKINYSLALDSSDDDRFTLKMIKPDYYQVVEKSSLNETESKQMNEVSPMNYDSDVDYYAAVRGQGKRRGPQEPEDVVEPAPRYTDKDAEADLSLSRQKKAAVNRPVVNYNTETEGTAPNGQRYNAVMTINAPDTMSADHEVRKFNDHNWGAKKIVDTVKDGSNYTVYIVDNHKYGMWTPFKDQPAELDEGRKGFDTQLVQILRKDGYKGPVRLGQLKAWDQELSDILDSDDMIMIAGNDPTFDSYVAFETLTGRYISGGEGGYYIPTLKQLIRTHTMREGKTLEKIADREHSLKRDRFRSLSKDSLRESEIDYTIGDDVVITGPVQYKGATGMVDSFGQDKRFVVVNLYNYGKHSFHTSDVSFNDYADSDEEEADMYDRDEDFRDWSNSGYDFK